MKNDELVSATETETETVHIETGPTDTLLKFDRWLQPQNSIRDLLILVGSGAAALGFCRDIAEVDRSRGAVLAVGFVCSAVIHLGCYGLLIFRTAAGFIRAINYGLIGFTVGIIAAGQFRIRRIELGLLVIYSFAVFGAIIGAWLARRRFAKLRTQARERIRK